MANDRPSLYMPGCEKPYQRRLVDISLIKSKLMACPLAANENCQNRP